MTTRFSLPNTEGCSGHRFRMKLGSMVIALYAVIEDATGNIIDIEVDHEDRAYSVPDAVLNLFTRIRRPDKDGGHREHDARIVSSRVDHNEGTFTFKVEASDYHIKLRDLALAAARAAISGGLVEIDGMNKGVIRDALRNL